MPKLIRATLQNTSKPFIPLPDEISYLSGYLSLEKLRFKEKMDYSIEIDLPSMTKAILFPPMLIQPYVENSMRHGLRHKKEGKGYIHVTFRKTSDRLARYRGRQRHRTKKSRQFQDQRTHRIPIERHVPDGRSDPHDERQVQRQYSHRRDRPRRSIRAGLTGTRVIMEFPLFHILLENQAI